MTLLLRVVNNLYSFRVTVGTSLLCTKGSFYVGSFFLFVDDN